MNNAISVALLSLSVTSSALVGGQKTTEMSKPASPAAQQQRDAGTQSSLSKNQTRPNTELTEIPATDVATESRRRYDAAMALTEAGRLDEAIIAFKQLLKTQPQDAQLHFGMGMTYSKAKAFKDAFESFRKAVRFKPEWPEAHFRLGVMSYVLGKKDQSNDEYKKLVQLNSPLGTVLYRIIKDDSVPAELGENVAAVDPNAVIPINVSATATDPAPRVETTPENTPAPVSETGSASNITSPSLTDTYRVGIADILDIRFLNSANGSRSTLFTVVAGGMIDFPVAGGPIMVAGLTTEEIQARIATELKRRAIEENSQISVGVRQYSSHSVMVTGLVGAPGSRILRREAVPLYVVLAEAQLRNDAGRITIMRGGSAGHTLDLNDPTTLNTVVLNGDVITVTGRPQEFYYIAGRINYPGQKNFQSGITLLQAILASGGTTRQNETLVEISREGSEGRLVTTRFDIREIKAGTIQDPKLQPGDRIQVIR